MNLLSLALTFCLALAPQDLPVSDVSRDAPVAEQAEPVQGGEGNPARLGSTRPVLNLWLPDPVGLHTASGITLPNHATDGYTIHKKQVTGTWASVIGFYKPTLNMTVTSSVIQGKWYNKQPSGQFGNWTKWGLRLYDVQDFLAQDTVFRDIGNEHGAYLNVAGDVTFDKCYFYNIGSQGLQFVFRTTETSNPAWAKNPGRILVRRSVFQQCTGPGGPGWPAARSSFTISSHPRDIGFKNPGQDLVVKDVYMEAEWPEFTVSGKKAQSFGAIMCEWHDTLRIKNVWIDYTRPYTRPVIQAHNLNRMIMRDTYVKEGRIDIKGVPFVRIERCTGNAEIWDYVNGSPTKVGNIADGYIKGA